MNTSIRLFYENIINKLDTEVIINSINENLYISPFSCDNIINSNSIDTILHKIIKEFKIKRGTTKKIVKPGPRELNKFYRDNNITELYDTNIFNIQYKNEYAIKIKPYIILSTTLYDGA